MLTIKKYDKAQIDKVYFKRLPAILSKNYHEFEFYPKIGGGFELTVKCPCFKCLRIKDDGILFNTLIGFHRFVQRVMNEYKDY